MTDRHSHEAPAISDPYGALGVRTFINCCGARTVHGGSLMPEAVVAAMDRAARSFVHVPELLERAGERIAELLGAEAALVSAGGASALTVATAGVLTGGDPELMLRLPAVDGRPRDVLMPAGGRFAYDQAVRAAGAEIIEVPDTTAMRERLAGGAVAMVAVLGGRAEAPPIPLAACIALASQFGVPVLVDAASEAPACPDRYLAQGASMVAYSGGKYLRGPQSTGLLLGTRRWIGAAFRNAAPHHAVARGMKVSKEEICGIVAAVELLMTRDSVAETRAYHAELESLADVLSQVPGVRTELRPAGGRVEATPSLLVDWSETDTALHGLDLCARMLAGTPAVMLDDRSAEPASLIILPFNLRPGEGAVVGRRLATELRAVASNTGEARPAPTADVSGEWSVLIGHPGRESRHHFSLAQNGERISGTHETADHTTDIAGTLNGDGLQLVSQIRLEGTHLAFRFLGDTSGDSLSGQVELGTDGQSAPGPLNRREFGRSPWRALRIEAVDGASARVPATHGTSLREGEDL